jgi:hypothetical protein
MINFNKHLEDYLRKVVGVKTTPKLCTREELQSVPLYLKNLFTFWRMELFGKTLVLAKVHEDTTVTAGSVRKQFEQLRKILGNEPVLIAEWLPSVTRVRLAEKRVNFIVPGRQIFLPAMLIDQSENKTPIISQKGKLRPATQAIFLFCLLHQKELFDLSFQNLAAIVRYSQMAVSIAANELRHNDLMLIRRRGRKNYLEFSDSPRQLWSKALPLLMDPVIKRIFVDGIPEDSIIYKSNIPALAEYTVIDAGRQEYFAIGRKTFRESRMIDMLVNPNKIEGTYCFEIWKYDPGALTRDAIQHRLVDPLSLYLSLRKTSDERLEAALNHIIETSL